MPLLRGFSVIDEEGKFSIPSNIRGEVGLNPGSQVGVKVVRIKGTGRCPYLIVYHPQRAPLLSQLEATVMENQGIIDEKGRLVLKNDMLEQTKLEPDYRVEIKVVGPKRGPWAVISNRGPNRLTTLQEKIGRLGKNQRGLKKWQTQKWDY